MALTASEPRRSIIRPGSRRISKPNVERHNSCSHQKPDLRFPYAERVCLRSQWAGIAGNVRSPKVVTLLPQPRADSISRPGTSHVVTADASGMAISLTTTINLLFGSQLMIPETGVIMNNEMNDFSIPNSSNAFGYVPSPSNFIRPGKRPLSSISPTIVEFLTNRTLYFVVGSAGGSRIITATIQNLWHVLDQGFSSIGALSEPRLHDQLQPNQ